MKTIAKLLCLFMVFGSVFAMTSCKDYNEDQYNELRDALSNQNTTLKQLIEAQNSSLQSEIDNLKAALANVKSCTCEESTIDKKIAAALEEYQAQHPELKEADVLTIIKKYMTENPGLTEAEVQALVDKALADYCKKNECLTEDRVNELIKAATDALPKCTVTEEFVRQLIAEATKNLVSQEQLEKAIKGLEDTVSELSGKLDELSKKEAQDVKDILDLIDKANKAAAEAQSLAQTALDKANENATAIDGLKTTVDNLDKTVQGLSDDVAKALKDANNAQATADADSLEIIRLWAAISALNPDGNTPDLSQYVTKADIETLKNDYYTKAEIDSLFKGYATICFVKDQCAETLAAANAVSLYLFSQCYTKLEVDSKVKDLQDQIDALKADVKDLQDAVKDLQDRMDAVEKSLADLTDKVKDIENALNQLVTGIIVQGAENPVFGEVALPANISSNVLMAFYGNSVNSGKFPTTDDSNYATLAKSRVLTDKEAQMIGSAMESFDVIAGTTLISDEEDNAGTMYVTINPSNVDFTGVTLDLENSQEKAAGVTLTPLAKSDKTLTFGYSRAGNNGFYETKAKITADDIDGKKVQTVKLSEDDCVSLAENLAQKLKGNSFDITSAVSILYNQLNNVLDANAAKVSYTDSLGTSRSIYSLYSTAAGAVCPLSYNFGYMYYGRSTFYGYEEAEALINTIGDKLTSTINTAVQKAIDQIKDQMPETPTLKKFTLAKTYKDQYGNQIAEWNVDIVNNIVYKGTEYSFQNVDGKYVLVDKHGKQYSGTDVTVVAVDGKNNTATINVTINLTEQAEDIYKDIYAIKDNVDDLVEALEKYTQQMNDILDSFDISSVVSSASTTAKSALMSLLDAANAKAVGIVNTWVMRMQPCMVFSVEKDGKSVLHYASGTLYHPTEAETASITLMPISHTWEILNPAYKKHIACVNVMKDGATAQDGDATCKAELDNINGLDNMNTVIDGNIREIPVTLKSGYTYQFAYSALDYTGTISTVRACIAVK